MQADDIQVRGGMRRENNYAALQNCCIFAADETIFSANAKQKKKWPIF
jgi:hypothetical protein